MIPRDVIYRHAAELAHRNRRHPVPSDAVRRSICAYARCYGIVHRVDGTLTSQQLRRAMAVYREQLSAGDAHPELLSA